jgi:sulfoxide reductase heme-binding subunit YedZ
VLSYLWLDQFFIWEDIWSDILERPFITVGFFTFLILVLLASTSTQTAMRYLKRNWLRLHKLIFVAAIAAMFHFWWMKDAKADVREPLLYAGVLVILLGFRLGYWIKKRGLIAQTALSR